MERAALSRVKRRSWLAAAGVLGLVGSLLAAGAGPAGGVDGEADNGAVYSACVGAALESRGLVDVAGSFAEDAVNCLAHFGVTQGRTETTYDPGSPVLRWQMALFLARAAGPAGVGLPANPAGGFADIGGVFESGRLAINQMAALDIMPGLTSTAFRPDLAVSRAQMALMLDSFLVAAEKGAGLGLGALGADADELADVSPDDSVFNDINNVTRQEYSAIQRMFELGVARGTADGSFSPGGLVTRAQMAVFITRMLAHTVARPAGINLQAAESSVTEGESVDLVVSVRDSGLMGVPDALVDVFSAVNVEDAFGEDGRCSDGDVSAVGGSGVCEISLSDQTTDPSGDLELSVDNLAESTTLWAWTGENGDRYDADDEEGSSLVITVSKAGTKLRVTDDMPEGATAASFGERVVFTLQVVDEDGNPVAKKDEAVTVFAAETIVRGGSDGAPNTSSSTRSYKTDASGKLELSFRQTDPRTGSGNTGDSARLDLDITLASGSSLELEDKTNLGKAGPDGAGADDAAAVWRDSTPVATTLTLTQAVSYHEASAAGSGAANVVTATLTDQFGNPVSRQQVEFASDDPDGIGAFTGDPAENTGLLFYVAGLLHRGTVNGVDLDATALLEDVDPNRGLMGAARWTRTTNRRGVATLSYSRESADAGVETIIARVKAELPVPLAQARSAVMRHEDKWDARSGDIMADRVYHYWGEEPSKGASVQGRLVLADTENNRLVLVGDDTVSLVSYDSNDHLNVADDGVDLAGFEKNLKEDAEHVSVGGYQTDSRQVSRITAKPEWDRLFLSAGSAGIPADGDPESADNLLQRFGTAFAADDGVIAVGAPRYQYTAGSANRRVGRVLVYDSFTDADPAVLTPPVADRVSGLYFGQGVDIDGDTIVVAANKEKVYVYVKPSGGWADTDTPTATFGGSSLDGNFGKLAAIDGDTIVVGAGNGIAVYEKPSAGGWGGSITPAVVTRSGTGQWSRATRSLDVDEDAGVIVAGRADAAVDGEQQAGWTLVFEKTGANWTSGVNIAVLTPPEPVRGGHFGQGAAVAGGTVVVGEHRDPNTRALWGLPGLEGKVHVFTKPSGNWADTDEPAATFSASGVASTFGFFSAISSDGSTIAAADHYQQEGDWRGSVRVFTKPSGGWSNDAPSEQYVGPAPGGRFGWGTAIDRTSGAVLAALRQEKTGTTTAAIGTGECKKPAAPKGGSGTDTVEIPEHCFRYLPIYRIDR